MDELKLIFASNLIRLRTAAGMTQAELGEQLNYSDKSISKWERGEAIPDAAVLKRMSEIFGVTVDYLLNEHDAWQPGPEPAACDRSHSAIILVALMGIVTLAVLVFVVLWLWLGAVEWIVFACFVPAAVITYLVLNSVFFGGRGNLYVVLGLVASIFAVGYLVLIKSRFLRSFLFYVPYVTLAVMTFPSIVHATNSPIAGLAALVLGIAAAWFGANLFQVAVGCCAVVLVLEFFLL